MTDSVARPVVLFFSLCVLAAVAEPSSRETDTIRRKLKGIVIPQIEFEEASVREVFAYLRKRSKDLDPDGVGVNFILQSPPPVRGQRVRDPFVESKITISMDKVPLGEAIRYVGLAGGLKFRIDPNAIVVVDEKSVLDVMETRIYTVDPNVLRASGAKDAKSLLENFGIEFPPGAAAGYNRASSKMVVKNTNRNLDRVEELLKQITGER